MKIIITDCDHGFFDPEREIVSKAGGVLAIHQCREPDEVIAVAKDAHGLLCQYVPITRAVLENLPQLRVVGRYGVGVDNIDVDAASELGIPIVYAPDFCTEEVANHTVALILALSRSLVALHLRYTRDYQNLVAAYENRFVLLERVRRSEGQVLGLIGFGRIAVAVAKRARPFGYRILAYDRYVTAERIRANGAEPAGLDELLQASDVVSLHCPLSRETHGLIGGREFRLMKPTAYLVNTARGALVDELALVECLDNKRLAGAALDVTQVEPLGPTHPFLAMEQVILTPHVAFYSKESILQLKKQVAQSMVRALNRRGEFPLANPQVLSKLRA